LVLERFNAVAGSGGLRMGPDYSLPRTKNNYKGEVVAARILALDPLPLSQGSEPIAEEKKLAAVDPEPEASPSPSPPTLPPPPLQPQPTPLIIQPQERKGWLKKEARKSFLKNWKNRYFVLAEGLLTYYESSSTTPPYGQNERGTTRLRGAKLEQKGSTNILIHFERGEDRDLLVQCADARDRTEWLQALQAHISFYSH
jgi:hypothetical protein